AGKRQFSILHFMIFVFCCRVFVRGIHKPGGRTFVNSRFPASLDYSPVANVFQLRCDALSSLEAPSLLNVLECPSRKPCSGVRAARMNAKTDEPSRFSRHV